MKETTLCGRPAGRKKTAKIEVLIEPEIKEEFMRLCVFDVLPYPRPYFS